MESIDSYDERMVAMVQSFKDSDAESITIDKDLSKKERAEIHEICELLSLFSVSETVPGTTSKRMLISKEELNKSTTIDSTVVQYIAKHTGLSFPVPLPEYLDYYIDVLDKYFNSKEKYARFTRDLNELFDNNPKLLMEHLNSVFERVKADILSNKELEAYKMTKYNDKQSMFQGVYNMHNSGKYFLSIDIRSANFTMMKEKVPTLFEESTWEEYISKFTKSEFVIKSKHLREMIFGDLHLSNRVKKIAATDLAGIIEQLKSRFNLDKKDIVLKCGDEIVYKVDLDEERLAAIRKYLNDLYPNKYHIEYFKLVQLGRHPHFVKEHADSIDFKCVPKVYIMQAIRFYDKEECTERDLEFIYEGKVAMFKEGSYK